MFMMMMMGIEDEWERTPIHFQSQLILCWKSDFSYFFFYTLREHHIIRAFTFTVRQAKDDPFESR